MFFFSETHNAYENEYDKYFKKLLRLFIRHNFTWTAFVDIMKTINQHPDAQFQFPDTQYTILSRIEHGYNFIEYGQCEKCDSVAEIVKTSDNKCPTCNTKLNEDNVMIYIPIQQQLKHELKKHAAHLSNEMIKSSDVKRDIVDGNMYTMSKNKIHFTFFSDGVQAYKSSKLALWPIYLVQNYLPPHIRYKKENMIVVALHYGTKPNMNRFFLPLVSDMCELYSSGLLVDIYGESRMFQPCIVNCVADLPAKHAMTHFKLYNSYYGCLVCYSKGELVGRNVRYTFEATPAKIRTMEETLRYMKNPYEVKGVQNASAMVALPEFDLINGFTIDYMHCICMGIVKKIVSIWLDKKNKNQQYYLTEAKVAAVDRFMSQIKPPSFFTRRPRSIKEFPNYKACEARAFLLYFFYPTFSFLCALPSKYIEHMQVLSAAVYTLLGTNITTEVLDDVHKSLIHFVSTFESFYSKENTVMNLHLLLHLRWTVQNWGPLWCQSAFPYETMNGVLTKYIIGPVRPVHQIITKYAISKCVGNYAEELPKKIREGLVFDYSFRAGESELILSSNFGLSNMKIFGRCGNGNDIYTSEIYRNTSYIDYFVRVENTEHCEKIGKVRFFFAEENFILEEYEVKQTKNQFYFVTSKNILSIHSVSNIKLKMIYIKLKSQFAMEEIIVRRPNVFESE